MANEINAKYGSVTTVTITMSSIATAAGRVGGEIDNTTTRATRGFLAVRLKTGAAAPTAGSLYKFYLIRNSNDATNIQGGRGGTALGASDAAVSVEPVNAECVGSIQLTASAATTFDELFPVQDPGPKFSFVFWNASAQTTDTTAGNHVMQWAPVTDEVQ